MSLGAALLLGLLGTACQADSSLVPTPPAPAEASALPTPGAPAGATTPTDTNPNAASPGAAAAASPEVPASPGAGPATPAPGLPDLSQGLATGSCGNGPGNEGADSYFIGDYSVSGNLVQGTERWLLHANSKLQAAKLWTGGSDCEVRWMMRGTTTSPLHCGDCDLGLQLTATVDLTGSTCPEDMVKREKSFEVRYDVRRSPDGVAWFYFANSGKRLGQGYHQGDRMSYLTQHQCKWF